MTGASLRNTTDAITAAGGSIAVFQALLQGDYRWPETAGLGFGTHGGGHYSIGTFFVFFSLLSREGTPFLLGTGN